MNGLTTLLEQRGDALLQALLEHVQISVLALLIAVLISVPLGLYLTRHERIAEPIIGVTAVLQTIPSLALLGLLIPVVGIGTVPAVIALFLYALLPIVRNTYTGIKEVDPSLIEAARAMGMNSFRRLVKVELPLALPVIMAGIRTAMVLIIGTATIVALIGAGGLGSLILLGIDRSDNALILLGAIPAALLAIVFDVALRIIENFSKKGSKKRPIIMVAILVLILSSPFIAMKTTEPDLVIGGKLGAEPDILINMYKQLIEDETNLKVDLRSSLGKTVFVFEALRNKEIDIYPEYTGTALVTHLKEQPDSNEASEVYEQAKIGLKEKFDLAYLQPMAFNNTYTLTVTKEFAEQNNVKTISDLTNVADQVKAGLTLEFKDREDGYAGLQKEYGLALKNVKTMEPKLRYNAVQTGDINLLDAYATDPEIEQYNLAVLEDDEKFFPPYQGAPVLREETLKEYPELKEILNKLAGKITDEEMRKMNYEVNAEGKAAEEVARKFLVEKGLISGGN
ncbi:glycine/betaine ABC transporter permease [Priestia aryabhattai]|uniref:ABC transporter permease/substrate-binding protein n=1 Tax=Bacillaceae TaxID=186817 RepID=UPI000BA15C1C|nr:ABC transporter permease/substrate-binding protein [Bacillus sp. CBEL-1]OZT11929.1 glycine/betaine ABC transporter permease [Priestia aryabhattai]TDB50224.1 ABC transporter permease/substrate-binding protein [Bacillus sp. CBEL-1]